MSTSVCHIMCAQSMITHVASTQRDAIIMFLRGFWTEIDVVETFCRDALSVVFKDRHLSPVMSCVSVHHRVPWSILNVISNWYRRSLCQSVCICICLSVFLTAVHPVSFTHGRCVAEDPRNFRDEHYCSQKTLGLWCHRGHKKFVWAFASKWCLYSSIARGHNYVMAGVLLTTQGSAVSKVKL